MSPLFPERLLVGLAPAELTVGAKRYPCDPAFGAEPWHGALEALKGITFPRARVTVVLSNHFVRYSLVPWSAALATPAEEAAYLRHHFAKIHGERAKGWVFRASEGPRGEPRLASAVDAELVAAIRALFAKGGPAKLVSVQPALMHVFNGARASVPQPAGAWLVIAEPDRACIALHANGAFRAVQNAKGEWRTLLERERYRVDSETTRRVLLTGAEAPSNDPYWQFSITT
ncbi:MAG: hypothetical protein E6H54_14355 [Betaproteobacteria bacterium]|nr:MAG: hypothetical protein E6H54_14355 [Betaproteobacteria bacterium]